MGAWAAYAHRCAALGLQQRPCLAFYALTNSPLTHNRVGRTARAGRSGRSVTIVTQYDVEMFQKIEHLTGVKMEQFPAEREEVLLLLEQVRVCAVCAVCEGGGCEITSTSRV